MPSKQKENACEATVYMRRWRETHPEWDVKNAEHHKTKYALYKEKVLDLLGHACVACGYDDIRALQIDHINGDGWVERRKRNGNKMNRGYGYPFLKQVLEDPLVKQKFQILCANCNWIKRHVNKEMAHFNYT